MRFAVLLLVLLSAVALFAGLGRPAITDSDEAFYAEAGREMVEGGDWLTPRFNYENRFQKPVLFYWAVAACYTVAGVGEAGSRFGSALAGLGIVLVAFGCGRRWYDAGTGLLAGAIVATSFGCVWTSRLSLPDLPLAFFITVTAWSAYVALFDRHRRARRWWLAAGVAAALGFLTKGPVALVIPVLVLAVPFWLERGWRRVRATDLLLAAAAFVLVAAPWYVAMARVHGTGYLRGFFIGDNLERFATTAFNPHRSVFFYVPIVLGGMLPWSAFFALGVRPTWRLLRQRQRPVRQDLRLLCWAAAPFLLFTASVGKQPRYILPMLAPLALLLAVGIRRATAAYPMPDAQPRLFRWMAGLSGGIVILLAALLWRARPLLFARPEVHLTAGIVTLALTGAVVVGLAVSRRWRLSPAAITIAGVVFVLVLRYSIVALPDLEPVEQMAGRVLAHRQAGEPVASYHVFVRNLIFYTHVQQANLYTEENLVEFLRRPDRVLCVLPERELTQVQAAHSLRLVRLASITYFDPMTAKIGSVLWPDPVKDLRTAVLVSNR